MHIELQSGGGPHAIALFVRSVALGVAFVLAAWVAILAFDFWSVRNYNAKHGITGLGAASGGWLALLHSPVVVLILAGAFGVGFYLAIRLSGRG